MAEFNICRRQLQAEGEPVRYCTGRITKANALDWCDKCREHLPFWPTGNAVEDPALSKPGAAKKPLSAWDRKTGEGQEHLGPRGIESFVKMDEFTEAGS